MSSSVSASADSASAAPLPAAGEAVAPTARVELEALVRLAVPIVFAQLALMATTLVEVAVVGHQGVDDLAGVALGRTIGFSSMTVTMGVALALEPLASQALGAREPERAYSALKATLRAVFLVWALSAVAAFSLTFALAPLGIDPRAIGPARAFLTGQLPGLFGYNVFLAAKTFLQAHGRMRSIVTAAIAANVVNFVICNLLVRGDAALVGVGLPPLGLHGHGAAGAGCAFSVSAALLASVTLAACWRLRPEVVPAKLPVPARGGDIPSPVVVRQVLRLGIPIGMQILTEAGVFALAAMAAGRLGERVLSAHQVALALASTTYMAAVGVSGATAVRVGRAVGERRSPGQAGALGIGLGVAWMSLCALAFAVFPRFLVSIFTTDPEVIALGVLLLRIAAVFQLFDGVQTVALGALRGLGDVRLPFVFAVIAYWVIGLPLAVFLAFGLHMGAVGLWWGLTLALVIVSALLVLRFRIVLRRPIARVP